AGARKGGTTSLAMAGVIPLLSLAAVGPALAGEPTDQVQAAVTELYQLLATSRGAAEVRQRDAAAAKVMDRLFDWPTMARQSLRQHWETRTPAQGDEFTRPFPGGFPQG